MGSAERRMLGKRLIELNSHVRSRDLLGFYVDLPVNTDLRTEVKAETYLGINII